MKELVDCLDPIERYPDREFPVEVSCSPTISTFPSGKTYAVAAGTWIQVPIGSTREDLPKWMKYVPLRPTYDEVKVEGSKGNTYTVRRDTKTGKKICSCPGFKWRGKCKHLKKAFAK